MIIRNLLLVLLVASASGAGAQNLVTFGIRGGANFTTVAGDYTLDYYDYGFNENDDNAKVDKSASFKPGFNIGIDAQYSLNDKMALQAELFYSREGYKGEWTYSYEGNYKGTFTDQYNFLNLPVFFKYNFTPHFYVMAGPQISFLLSAKHKGEMVGYFGDSESTTLDLKDRMNKLGFGFTPGVGYDLNKMSFSLRYFAGLTSLAKSEYDDVNIKSQVLSVVVSYKVFTIKK